MKIASLSVVALAALVGLAVVSCGGDEGSADAAGGGDGGGGGGQDDGGGQDGGESKDAIAGGDAADVQDSGPFDAGFEDAGEADAGAADTGVGKDAGPAVPKIFGPAVKVNDTPITPEPIVSLDSAAFSKGAVLAAWAHRTGELNIYPALYFDISADGQAFGTDKKAWGSPGGSTVDRPQIIAGPDGAVYIFLYRDGGTSFVKSADGGATFSTPTMVDGSKGLCKVRLSPIGTIGEIYVVYFDPGEGKVNFNKSEDGGATWNNPFELHDLTGCVDDMYTDGEDSFVVRAQQGVKLMKINAGLYMHTLAVTIDSADLPYSPAVGSLGNSVHACWATEQNNSIYCAHSADQGQTFGGRHKAAGPSVGCYADEPDVAFDPAGGIHVIYRDYCGNGGAQSKIMYIFSNDGSSYSSPTAIRDNNSYVGWAGLAREDGMLGVLWIENPGGGFNADTDLFFSLGQ
ncbi:MAG: hypothetical protein HY897_00720 [Deltaproteobacteria bacterium]|nr:hypothetical protein [Deltaproteobacteria bacterium]